jgi:hypothetical protein
MKIRDTFPTRLDWEAVNQCGPLLMLMNVGRDVCGQILISWTMID